MSTRRRSKAGGVAKAVLDTADGAARPAMGIRALTQRAAGRWVDLPEEIDGVRVGGRLLVGPRDGRTDRKREKLLREYREERGLPGDAVIPDGDAERIDRLARAGTELLGCERVPLDVDERGKVRYAESTEDGLAELLEVPLIASLLNVLEHRRMTALLAGVQEIVGKVYPGSGGRSASGVGSGRRTGSAS